MSIRRISVIVLGLAVSLSTGALWSAEGSPEARSAAGRAAGGDGNNGGSGDKHAKSEQFNRGLDAFLRKNYATAHRYWQPLASSGDAVAAFNLGVMYARGHGVGVDPERAIYWYRKSADAGYSLAQFNLGAAYMAGNGVKEDHEQAAQWWARAARAGHPQALFNLGTLYLHGDGVPQDHERALNLIQQAADLGDVRAYQRLQSLRDPTAPPPVAPVPTAFRDNTPPATGREPEAAASKPVIVASATKTAGPVEAPQAQKPQSVPEKSTGQWTMATKRQPPSNPQTVVAASDQGKPAAVDKSAPTTDTARATETARDSTFMARQDPQHWTIQLSAFKAQAQAQSFVRKHKISAQAIVIQARGKSRPWWKVMYGVYPNAEPAKRAVGSLPVPLRKGSPWARRIGVVHKELISSVPQNTVASAPSAPAAQTARQTPVSKAPAPPTGATATTKGWRERTVQPAPAAEAAKPAAPATQTSAMARPPETSATPTVTPGPAGTQQAQFQRGQSAFNDQDYGTALRIWEPLAKAGMDEAQYGLGFMYESGWGVKKDYARAYQWYRRAAEQGHAKSQYNLGMLYQAGLGVPRNEALAYYWIQNAADQDDARAQEFLRKHRRDGAR